MPDSSHAINDRRRVSADGSTPGYEEGRAGLLVPKSFGYSRTFEAANWSRNRAWRPIVAQDARFTNTPLVRTTLMSHARALVENNGLVGGALDDTKRYTIADGIYPLPLTGDTGLDRELRGDFLQWAKIADVRGMFHLFETAEQQVFTQDCDGDNFTLLTSTDPGNPAGFPKIQLLRGHRCGNAGGKGETVNDGFFDGVRADRVGAPAFYRMLDPDDASKFTDYPAQGVIHGIDASHPDQIRGLSAIRRGINGMFDAKETMGFMHTKIKTDAQRAAVIKNSTGEVEEDVYDEPINQENLSPMTFEMLTGGELLRLGPGEEIQSVSGDNPGALFMPWMEFSFRDFAVGYGYPLEFIWKSDLGSAAQRFMLKKAQRRFNQRRNLFLIPKWFTRIYLFWLARMIVRKAYKRVPNWWKVGWQVTSPDLSIDAGRDSAAALNEMRFGSKSLHEDAGERGRYWLELREEVDLEADDLVTRAKKLAAKQDIDLQMAIALLQQRTPNGNLAVAAPAAPAPAGE